MDERPKWRPEWTPIDKTVEMLSWLFILAMWGIVGANFFSLPDTIPTHFNAEGKVDGYGEKYTILLFPAVITIVFFLLSEVAKRPWHFNYVVAPTPENYQELYRLNIRMLRIIRLVVAAMGTYVAYAIIRGAKEGGYDLSFWALPVFLAGMIVPAVVAIVKSFKLKS
ncbi:MAG: DUF1648 domain-containing protein [Chitinophagaceae bacterium]